MKEVKTMALKDEIKSKRITAGMGQFDLADAIGVHPTTIYNWESGKTKPTLAKVRLMAKILGISEQEILNPVSKDENKENEDNKNVP